MLNRPIGVIGSGRFGLAVTDLLAINYDVRIWTRTEEKCDAINSGQVGDIRIHERVKATTSLSELCETCHLIFPIVPSEHFRSVIRAASPHLRPLHILIHGTKGLDIHPSTHDLASMEHIDTHHISRMSEVIRQESSVLRIGCLSGPNLSGEIIGGQPTASVVASDFDEVIHIGQAALNSTRFFVFGSHDLTGTELAGTLKNIAALGSGLLAGRGLGLNIRAVLITRILHEIIYLGQELGSSSEAFLGTAGIGDLIATSLSHDSRNFSVGFRLGQGESLADILAGHDQVVEGIRTLQIARTLAQGYKRRTPIINILYTILFDNIDIDRAIEWIMRYPSSQDVDFM